MHSLKANIGIFNQISLQIIAKGLIIKESALIQVMVRRQTITWTTASHTTRWQHQMEAFSALLAFSEVNGGSPHKGQRRGALMFSLISAGPMAEQTIEKPMISDAIVLIMT